MGNLYKLTVAAALLVAVSVPVVCQAVAPEAAATAISPDAGLQAESTITPRAGPGVQALLAFKNSDVKFSVPQLMDILRDKRHEGWVLAAYPDPKTSRPLIGAGFSLDLPAREHQQIDGLNANPFYEPSSADLWQAAGLDPAELARILDEFHAQLTKLTARGFRHNIRNLPPQITDEEAGKLLRIAIIQSIVNARAYCRNFDEFSASQQMAISQLVYQMGVNLEQFTQFRALINQDGLSADGTKEATVQAVALQSAPVTGAAYWKAVQLSLVQSQWARLYRARALAVIAMFDPNYAESSAAAERRVGAVLRPAVVRRTRVHAKASTELAANHSARPRKGHRKRTRAEAEKSA